ncbi:MAG TPA: glycosyltransferase [Stellaceae bacterium]|nr:glycosyltransferase [Stellaceae bacterium]
MARVIMADDGIPFDGRRAAAAPLGGAETAVAALAEALAARGHRVTALSRGAAPVIHRGVAWLPLADGAPQSCDLYIANRGAVLLGLVRRAGRRVLWLHNPAHYLKKPRNFWWLLRHRPLLVVSGAYHAGTVPGCLPVGGKMIIPYGLLEPFRAAAARLPPPPIAIFTSNPLRGLDWLLDLWSTRIFPAVPEAELHVYAGPAVYAGGGDKADLMRAALARAEALQAQGVRRFAPVPHGELAAVLAGARLMLYRGDPGETFCLALAEAQAMGVPAVVEPVGCVAERVSDRRTGIVAADDEAFAAAAIALLRDARLWHSFHTAALAMQRGLAWDEVAASFEALIG